MNSMKIATILALLLSALSYLLQELAPCSQCGVLTRFTGTEVEREALFP